MKLNIADKFTVITSGSKAKSDLMIDIARSLQQDFSIPDIAADFEHFGTSLEKLAGKRMRVATTKAQPTYVAFEGIISDIALQTLKTGEDMGDMPQAFEKSSAAIESSEGLLGQLIMAYLIPLAKILGILIGLSMIGNEVFSQLKEIAPQNRWSIVSRLYYELTSSIYENWVFLLVGTISVLFIVWLLLHHFTGPYRIYLDKAPFFRQFRILTASSVLTQLGTLLDSGKPLRESITWIAGQQTKYGKWHLKLMDRNLTEVRNSGNFGYVLETGLVNAREVNRLKRPIPENQLGERLEQSSSNHSLILERQVKRLQSISNIAVLFFGFTMLLWFFAAVFFLVLSIQ